jgi:transcriptional regulator with XRE-family HTH domain
MGIASGGEPPISLRGHPAGVATRERRRDRGLRLARRALQLIGEEFRNARLLAGLTQQQVGDAVGISHTTVSRIELGRASQVSYETLVMMATVLGLDLPLRAYPSGEPIRDAGQVLLLVKLRTRLAVSLRWRTEVPLRIPGDRRAWDAAIGGVDWEIPVDAESRLRDVQAWVRREALKRRDDNRDIVILLVADTRHNRHVLRIVAPDLAADYPIQSAAALAALTRGDRPAGSAIVLL